MGWWWLAAGAVLAALVWWWLFLAGRHRFAHTRAAPREDIVRDGSRCETVAFPAVDGSEIEGWLVIPDSEHPPVILMAPGLTGTKEGPLERFAWEFAQAGFAVLMFDFRSFGGSAGTPRHWLDPLRQIEDYRAAITFVQGTLSSSVDTSRIVLWGSSFSGSAAICAAAQTPEIAAVVAQVPYLGGVPVHAPGLLQIAGYIALSMGELIGDAIAGLFGIQLAPVYITTYGKPGERTFAMSADNPSRAVAGDDLHPFWASIPEPVRGGWENRMLVRGLQNLDKVSAGEEIAKLSCPALLIGAMRDDMISFDVVRTAAGRMPIGGSRFVQFDCGHYDPYVAPLFEENIRTQVDFLRGVFEHSGH